MEQVLHSLFGNFSPRCAGKRLDLLVVVAAMAQAWVQQGQGWHQLD